MGVRKEVFARAKLFELWGKFELNFDLFSQKCWQILTSTRGKKRADARDGERALKGTHFCDQHRSNHQFVFLSLIVPGPG